MGVVGIRGRAAGEVRIVPATADRWDDVVRLAGDRGFTSGCWCMWWRLTSKEFTTGSGEERRAALASLVADGTEPGLLAYAGDTPIGWVAAASRAAYPRLDRSPKLRPVDDEPVWAITCFYIDRHHRRKGVGEQLLRAAVAHARDRGATIVEGYPIDTAERAPASADLYTGTLGIFTRAGFHEVERRGGRPIVRHRPD